MKKVLFFTASVNYHGRIWDLSSQEFRNYLLEQAQSKKALYKVEYLLDNKAYHLASYANYYDNDEIPKTAEVQWAEIDKSFDLEKILIDLYMDHSVSNEVISFLEYMRDCDDYCEYSLSSL